MLGELGYEVLQAASGQDALAIIDGAVTIDVLVTDHLMPDLSGAELARRFRARRPGAPVLVITGFADTLVQDGPHLNKPFRRDELAASLASLEAGPR